jgi:hypothetical protein
MKEFKELFNEMVKLLLQVIILSGLVAVVITFIVKRYEGENT